MAGTKLEDDEAGQDGDDADHESDCEQVKNEPPREKENEAEVETTRTIRKDSALEEEEEEEEQTGPALQIAFPS